ncbi:MULTISPECIES: polysaccharide deacetylase family protein [unclassified Massilia]|uniref:polysaccharide deacetylase family protein n=1 Tax=unclassified Massilia TaxID=2609279 RepID=UPI0009EB5E1C|nr:MULTISPECIES: polysaccharide deacetylase family protein [unclassified Massilia]
MTTLPVPSNLPARLIRAAAMFTPFQDADRLCVLNYHRILAQPDPLLDDEPTVETFRWQMRLVARYFNVLSLPDAIARLSAGRLPPRAVCITFDDGYRSVHDLAMPVLNEFGLPATVFVSTAYLDSGTMWNETIADAVRRLPDGAVDLSGAGLGMRELRTSDDRRNLLNELTAHAKYMPPAERQALTERLMAMVGGGGADSLMLTPEMIRTMAAQRFEIGAHTVSHPILTSLSDEAARHEIEQCKRDLEAITGAPVRYFAYPNGKVGKDFDERHKEMVRSAGFAAAFSTEVGPAVRGGDLFQLPRSRPWDANPFLFGLRLLRWLAQE